MNATLWQTMTKKQRCEWLIDAGYNPNAYYARAFNYLPSWVREDVTYAYNRKARVAA